MAIQVKQYTVEASRAALRRSHSMSVRAAARGRPETLKKEFEQWVELPENADRLFEYIGGEVVAVPSNPHSSEIAYNIGFLIKLYLRKKGIAGHVTGEAGGYRVGEERYVPDVAYISNQRQAALPNSGDNPLPPDLAVAVLSPSDDPAHIRIKITNYLAAGTTVWIVDVERRRIEVHAPGQPVTQVGREGVLNGGTLLPGFALALKDVFPDKPAFSYPI